MHVHLFVREWGLEPFAQICSKTFTACSWKNTENERVQECVHLSPTGFERVLEYGQ